MTDAALIEALERIASFDCDPFSDTAWKDGCEQMQQIARAALAMRATTPTAPIESLGALSGSHASTEPCGLGPSGFDPARLLMDELDKGIVNLEATLNGTETGDAFWHRYWAGYLRGYEGLRDKLRSAIATDAGTATTTEIGVVHEGAGPEDIAHD
jgi:hypothetical protein